MLGTLFAIEPSEFSDSFGPKVFWCQFRDCQHQSCLLYYTAVLAYRSLSGRLHKIWRVSKNTRVSKTYLKTYKGIMAKDSSFHQFLKHLFDNLCGPLPKIHRLGVRTITKQLEGTFWLGPFARTIPFRVENSHLRYSVLHQHHDPRTKIPVIPYEENMRTC